ncbi:hypothetical protein [Frankia sp. AgW1.1]|uniref:hypothetical protein n=1 Tax=Frankia sp. AgW1.1 TaxID=1836971 RepID=UPI001932D0F2|nr:hypothetical protein [Frankia sp. AgW1.1]MBL7487150.1 hypothetical protein [Frankia sp. AgW1.1]
MTLLDDLRSVHWLDAVKALHEAVTSLPTGDLDPTVRAGVESGEFADLPVAFDLIADLDELKKALKLAGELVQQARDQVEQDVVRREIDSQRWRQGRKKYPELGLDAGRTRRSKKTHDPDAAARLAAPFLLVNPDTGEKDSGVDVKLVQQIARRMLRFVSSPTFKSTEFEAWRCEPEAIAEVIRTEPAGWGVDVIRKPVASDA